MSAHHEALAPVDAPLWTPVFRALVALLATAAALTAYRFVAGIGAVTALNDGFAWGMWKPFNVIVLTALGSGGYATAMLVYFLNRTRYHSLVRTAILTSALGYTSGILALAVDVGRPWNMWVMVQVWRWNLHSPLLEVAVCVTLYLGFLWVEASLPFLERWSESPRPRVARAARRGRRWLRRAYPLVVAVAILLPTMHQSSLGSLFLAAGPRVHTLWSTDLLPLLFLLSAFFLGWAAVVLVAMVSARVWNRPLDVPLLASLARILGWVVLAFVALRWVDVLARGELGAALAGDRYSALFLLESVLLLPAAVALAGTSLARRPDRLFQLAALVAAGGSLYRLDASLVSFLPAHWTYFPSVAELVIGLGFVALAAAGFLYVVKRFPILAAGPGPAR